MSVRETAVKVSCADEGMVGVISHPQGVHAETGVLIIVGAPQYRVGSHRQFVLLSRALAQAGYPAMRFDYRGMGDSCGDGRNFDAVDEDIAAAMDALTASYPSLRRIVLWGLCDGASAALLYAQRRKDGRLAGLILANPWVHTEQAEAHAIVHAYYGQRLREGDFWRKLLTGGVNPLRKLQELAKNWRNAKGGGDAGAGENTDVFNLALAQLRLPMLLLVCERDTTAQRFLSYLQLIGSQLLQLAHVHRVDFAEADHTFSCAEWRAEVENATIAWLSERNTNAVPE